MARKLKARISKLEDVDEALRDLYEKADDGDSYVLVPEGIDDVVAGPLKRALAGEKERIAADFKGKFRERFGMLPDELDAKLKKEAEDRKKTEHDELEQKKQFDKLLESHRAESAKKQKELEEKLTAQEAELVEALVVGSATRSIATAKGKVKALLPSVLQRLKLDLDPETKKRVVRVLDEKGEIRTHKGGWMNVDQLLEELKADDDYAALFESDVVPGGGATTGAKSPAGGGKTMTRAAFSALTPKEQMARSLEPGFAIKG